MYNLKRTVDAATEPVTRDEAKDHLRVTGDDDNAIIDRCITASRQYFEDRTNRAVISQTLVYTLDNLYAACEPKTYWFYLPRVPLASVTSIYYAATDGSNTLWAASNYTVDTYSEPGRVALGFGKTWPVTRDQINAVTVTYVAGESSASTVPAGIKSAILCLISDIYYNRETLSENGAKPSLALDRVITPWIVGDAYYNFSGVE